MSKKRYAAVICEYNPFHYGHLKQIEFLKNEFDGVICIMSGNLVQRGEIAVADKYSRAKAAVMCGTSLVVSLPFPFCMMSARDFASAGVYIAAMLGADALAFGCEDDFSLLERISEITEDISFEQRLEELIREEKNLSYPKARELLLTAISGEEAAEIIRKPNNILTLEYLSAIKKGGYNLKPFPVTRDITLRSSSTIRAEKSRSQFLSMLPESSAAVYGGLSEDALPRSAENLSQYIIGTLRGLATVKNEAYGTPSDLYSSIISASMKLNSFTLLTDICQNSLYTSARVRRSILSLVLGVKPEDTLCKPVYTLLLAADEEGCAFIKNRKKQLGIPVITKPAHIKKESKEIQQVFYREAQVDSIIALSAPGFENENVMEKTPYIKFSK